MTEETIPREDVPDGAEILLCGIVIGPDGDTLGYVERGDTIDVENPPDNLSLQRGSD